MNGLRGMCRVSYAARIGLEYSLESDDSNPQFVCSTRQYACSMRYQATRRGHLQNAHGSATLLHRVNEKTTDICNYTQNVCISIFLVIRPLRRR